MSPLQPCSPWLQVRLRLAARHGVARGAQCPLLTAVGRGVASGRPERPSDGGADLVGLYVSPHGWSMGGLDRALAVDGGLRGGQQEVWRVGCT